MHQGWKDNADGRGMRKSARSGKESERANIVASGDKGRRKPVEKKSVRSSSDSHSESEEYKGRPSRKGKLPNTKLKRKELPRRRNGVSPVSSLDSIDDDSAGTQNSTSESERDQWPPSRSKSSVKSTRTKTKSKKPGGSSLYKRRDRDGCSSRNSESEEDPSPWRGKSVSTKQKPKPKKRLRRGRNSDSSEYDFGNPTRIPKCRLHKPKEKLEWNQTSQPVGPEVIQKVLGSRRGMKGATGSQTKMYVVDESGDPNKKCDPNNLMTTEVQYLIKWKNKSHIHNTWESDLTLKSQKVNANLTLKRFKNQEQSLLLECGESSEDIEYKKGNLELQAELLKTYNFIDRIIAERETYEETDGPNLEYFVKWENLPYKEATWENSSIILKKWPDKIKEFQDRENSKRTPSNQCSSLTRRPNFSPLKLQPEYMGSVETLELRDYQLEGVNWLIHSWSRDNSGILADEMGLGKTIQIICFLYYLFREYQMYGPFLIVIPLSTMIGWQREFALWAPEMNVIMYVGDMDSRTIIREVEWRFKNNKKLKFNVIVTTYELMMNDASYMRSVKWAALLVDEAHRLKNNEGLLYKTLIDFTTDYRLLITGTPLQNSLKELWALLHFIMPQKFPCLEAFRNEHEHTRDKGYPKLHDQLKPYIIRRVKKDVEKSLPLKVEQILRVEMTPRQKRFYKWILSKNFDALNKGVTGSRLTFKNILMQLRKCCNHTFLTKPVAEEGPKSKVEEMQELLRGSGKLVLLDKLLVRLREKGHRVLIFSQMTRMLDILAVYLKLKRFPFQQLDGRIKGELRKQALDHFNSEGSKDYCFLLSTRAGGQGINLATADTVIIFDSDWNPQNDLQAQARAHRIGQKNQVNVYRLVTRSSVEEQILGRAKQKMVLDHLVIQRMNTSGYTLFTNKADSTSEPFNTSDLKQILKFGAEDLFKDDEDGNEEPFCDIDEILQKAEIRNEEATPSLGEELLAAFKVASFAAFEEGKELVNDQAQDDKDWEEIIPLRMRSQVDYEELKENVDELNPPPRRCKNQAIEKTKMMTERKHSSRNKKSWADKLTENIVEGKKTHRHPKGSSNSKKPGNATCLPLGRLPSYGLGLQKNGKGVKEVEVICLDDMLLGEEEEEDALGEPPPVKCKKLNIKKFQKRGGNERFRDSYKIVQQPFVTSAGHQPEQDQFSLFAEYVSNTLRYLPRKELQDRAKRQIKDILLEVESESRFINSPTYQP